MRIYKLQHVLSVILFFCCFTACSGNGRGVRPIDQEIKQIRGLQAEHAIAIDNLREQLQKVVGKLENIEHTLSIRTDKIEKVVALVSSRVPPPEGVDEKLLSEDEERISRNSGGSAEQFRDGLRQIRSGDFKGAYLTFANFKDMNPDTAFTDNAYYWIGVCLEKLGQYDRAIVAFSDVYQKFPAEDRVPHALFKLGEAFEKLGSIEDARLSYRKLIKDYPKSSMAFKAKKRLSKLKRR